MASLTIPGIIISKATVALSTTSATIPLGSMTTTARRKANAVLLVYHGSIDIYVSLDGTTAAVNTGFLMNAALPLPSAPAVQAQPLQQLLLYGLPTINIASASGTPSIEVYIMSIPGVTL